MKKLALTLLTTTLLATSVPASASTNKQTDNPFSFEVGDNWAEISRQVAQERRQGNYEKAIALSNKIIAIAQKNMGGNSPATVLSYQALGLSYIGTKQYAESNKAFLTAEEITHTLEKQPEYADYQRQLNGYLAFSTQYIAKNFYVLKNYKQALQYAEQADEYHQKIKPNIYDMSDNLELISQIYYEQQDSRYLPSLTELIELNSFRLGKQDRQYLNWTNALVNYYMTEQQPEKAIALYTSMIDKLEKIDDSSTTELMINYQALGFIYRADKRYQKSLEITQKFLATASKTYGEDSIYTIPAYIQVGSAYIYLKDNKKAKEYLLQARSKTNKAEDALKAKDGDKSKEMSNITFAKQMIDKYLAMIQ